MKRDAEYKPQAFALRPVGNSPSVRHLTPVFLLFYTIHSMDYALYYKPIFRSCQVFPANSLKFLAQFYQNETDRKSDPFRFGLRDIRYQFYFDTVRY